MNRKQTFVDLGCGNGLLTFLLVSEGYDGFGVDIADRKIWPALCKNNIDDMLRGKTLLSIQLSYIFIPFSLVEALYPSKITYPTTEWLIGNHADELVPW